MCYTKCNAGGLRACSIYSFENTIFILKIMTILWMLYEILNAKLVHLLYQRSSYTLQYIMVPKFLVFAQASKTGRCYSLKVQRNMCICIYKNIIKKYFILYKYFIVYYIIYVLWTFYFENHV